MAEWIRANINRFGNENVVDTKHQILTDIKIKLGNLSSADARQISENLNPSVDLDEFLSQLTSNNREFAEEICEILKSLFTVMEPGVILRLPSNVTLNLLSQERSGEVKNLVLQEILRAASVQEQLPLLIRNTGLLMHVVQKISDEDLGVAINAMSIFKMIGRSKEGCQTLYSGTLLSALAKLLPKNDVVSFRVYEIVVDIAISSKDGLETSIRSGFLQSLISMLDNEDILLQLNALESLTSLALTEDGLNYLENQDVLQNLAQKIARANESPLSNLLIPGLMKFFGNVARFHPHEIFSRYSVVISALFEVIESGDAVLLGPALDTLGHVASKVEGKYALESLGPVIMQGALKKMEEVILKMPTELRIHGLHNLALILEVKKSEQDNRILSLTKMWFDSLSEEPLKIIVSLCKQPFADVRKASLECLFVIAAQTWGQEYIANYPGLTEFLLDRTVESFKECKEAKYEVVKILSESVPNIFDSPTLEKFKQFVSEGPFYITPDAELATEGAS